VKLRYTRTSLAQLDTILTYIDTHNPGAARRVLARIHRAIHRLARFPYSAPATTQLRVRALTVPGFPYVVYYAVHATSREVHILRVLHARQARDD
jgi:plasmid stabilization system protein ParE